MDLHTNRPADRLSPRERDIIRGLMAGMKVKAIARELRISESTVRNHLRRAYCTVNVHSAASLIAFLCGSDAANGASGELRSARTQTR